VRLRVRVSRHLATRSVAVAGATVRARGARARTNRSGVATLTLRPAGKSPIVVRASKRGFAGAMAKVRLKGAMSFRAAPGP
jgi:hypothetical protein